MFGEKVKKIEDYVLKKRKAIGIILIALVFITLFLVYLWIEFKYDDFDTMYKWDRSGLDLTLHDCIEDLIMYYKGWGGRLVSGTIVELLFLFAKPISSLLCSLMFVLLAVSVSNIVDDNKSICYVLLSLSLLFYLSPSRDEIILWFTGSACYVWTNTIIFLTVKPFTDVLRNHDFKVPKKYYIFLPLYLLAGCSIENIAISLFLFLLSVAVYEYIKTKHIDAYKVAAILLEGTGCGVLMLAPGNYARAAYSWSGIVSTVVYRIHNQLYSWSDWLFLPLLLFVILHYCNYRRGNQCNKIFTYSLLVWHVLTTLAFLGAPSYPARAASGAFCIILILIIDEIKKLVDKDRENFRFINILSMFMTLCLTVVLFSIAMTELSFLI